VSQVTQILHEIERGESGAAERLLPLVYRELRRLAAARVARERAGPRPDATSLVHEAYLRLVGNCDPAQQSSQPSLQQQQWDNRGHFFAAAAEAMRRILVDNARRNRRPKHGGDLQRVELDQARLQASAEPAVDVLALDEALDRLAAEDPEKAQVVKLRYFAGLSIEETAAAMGISPATAKRRWAYARAWLYSALNDS
jgi:RNA polymerase sigma factor (TIGR02999 family)